MNQTTIAAIATPQGSGGVGIVRLSGPEAVTIVDGLFTSYYNKTVEELDGFSGTLGQIFDQQQLVDEVIVFRYRAPKSYTGEDIIEISGHGGSWVMSKILRLCYDAGAVPAEAGEFTKRAFVNGKLDLTQAEAVMDIISAQGDGALKAANQRHQGALFREISVIAQGILVQAGHLAAWADFPEEEMEEVEEDSLLLALTEQKKRLDQLLASYGYGRILKEGVPTAIVGKPNVGKSTLMNLLTGYDRSIVSDIPGTTRDIVTESVRLGDIVLQLNDTAGIRESDDPIEKIGIQRARDEISNASLVLALFDNSQALSPEDHELLALLSHKPTLLLINKSDLVGAFSRSELEKYSQNILLISALEKESIDAIEPKIKEILGFSEHQNDQVVIANERQRQQLKIAGKALEEARNALEANVTLDAVTVCLEECLDALFALTGQRASEEIVTQVFSNFCVGK